MCCGRRAVFPSIRAQLTAWLALLITLCLAAFAFYLYVAVAQILTADVDQTLHVQAQQVAATYKFEAPESGSEEDGPSDDAHADDRFAAARVFVETLDARGQVLARSANLGPRHLPLPAPAAALLEGPRLSTQRVPGGALRVYSLPVSDDGQTVGLAVVAASLDEVRGTTRVLLSLLVAGGLGVLILA